MAAQTQTYPIFRSQPMQQNKNGPVAPLVPPTPGPPAPPAPAPTPDPADPNAPLGAPGIKALQEERAARAAAEAELKALKASSQTPDQRSAAQLAEMQQKIVELEARTAVSEGIAVHGLPKGADVAVGTLGTPEQITARAGAIAKLVSEAVAAAVAAAGTPGATPPPGLPGSPNAGQPTPQKVAGEAGRAEAQKRYPKPA